jgi:hypothetical protein
MEIIGGTDLLDEGGRDAVKTVVIVVDGGGVMMVQGERQLQHQE